MAEEATGIKRPAHSMIRQGDIFDDSPDSPEEGEERGKADPRLRPIVAMGLKIETAGGVSGASSAY